MFDQTKPDFRTHPSDAAETSFLVPYYRAQPCYESLSRLQGKTSILHSDVLALLFHFGAYAGSVLELGPYIGGSTIALCWGKESTECKKRVITVELGTGYSHHTLSTDNIVRDLRTNLERFELDGCVNLIVGNSRDPDVIREVERLADDSFGLMVVDSDGLVESDFASYKHLLKRGAYLIVDDYFSPGAPEKVGPTRSGLLALMSNGLVECLGVYGWGTWVGRVK